MPTTVNGIGTTYYGKRNRSVRRGACRHCQREAELASYDTRLWFVIIFIPVIPLGRKRIMDQCSLCGWHYVAKADEWEVSKQLNVSGALEEFRSQPTPENALIVHARYLGYHQHDEAEAFRKEAVEQFSNSDVLFAGLGFHLEQVGRWGDASAMFEKAHQLRPDVPEVRAAVAQRRMSEGKLDEARELLDFLEKPGAAQLYPVGPLDQLAGCYQAAGRHEEALQLAKRLIEEIPGVGQIPQFRKFVQKSERAAGLADSILPPRERSLRAFFNTKDPSYSNGFRWLVGLTCLAVLVAIGLAVNNEFVRRNRTLHIVNTLGQPVTVSIDGRPPVTVPFRGTVSLPEGQHVAAISGAVSEQVPFDLHTGYFERWTRSPLWVLNVDRQAVLVFDRIFYAARPQPTQSKVEAGQRFVYFPHVDYPFTEPPRQIKVDAKRSSAVEKTHVEIPPWSPSQRFQYVALSHPDVAFRIAETHLKNSPADHDLLETYVRLSILKERPDPARKVLQEGLGRRPVDVMWHRAYQNLSLKDPAKLLAEYDRYLAKEPKNGALLYLRGRITPDAAESHRLFEQARDLDPMLPWPWFALGYDLAAKGEWAPAREFLQKARERKLPEDQLDDIEYIVRLGQGEAALLEQEYRQKLNSDPADVLSLFRLCNALAVQEKLEVLKQTIDSWHPAFENLPAEYRVVEPLQRGEVAIMRGDLDELKRLADGELAESGSPNRLRWMVLSGKAAEAADNPAFQTMFKQSVRDAPALCLALSLQGDENRAKLQREKICDLFQQRGDDWARAAEVLRKPQPPTPAELDAVIIPPGDRVVWLALVARTFPPAADDLKPLIQRLNVSRQYPYSLVKKVAE